MYYVYLLKSERDGQHYIGQTDNVIDRVSKHNAGIEKSTKSRTPFRLLGYETFQTRGEAMWRERELKRSAQKRKIFFMKFKKLSEESSGVAQR